MLYNLVKLIALTNLSVTPKLKYITLQCDPRDQYYAGLDLDRYVFVRYLTLTDANADTNRDREIESVVPSVSDHHNLTPGSTYYYRCFWRDILGNTSVLTAAQAGIYNAVRDGDVTGQLDYGKVKLLSDGNLFRNPGFTGGGSSGWAMAATSTVVTRAAATVAGAPSAYVCRIVANGTWTGPSLGNPSDMFEVSAGETFAARFFAAADGIVGTGNIFMACGFANATNDGVFAYQTAAMSAVALDTAGIWQEITGLLTAPTDVNGLPTASMFVYFQVTNTLTAGSVFIAKPRLRRATTNDMLTLNAVAEGNLQDDSISKNKVKSKAITAKHVNRSDDGLVMNGKFLDGADGWAIGANGLIQAVAGTDITGASRLRSADRDAALSDWFDVDNGEAIFARAVVYNENAEAANLMLHTTDDAGGNGVIQTFSGTNVKLTWTQLQGTLVITNAGATRGRILLQCNKTQGTNLTTYHYWGKVKARRAVHKQSIVLGAVGKTELGVGNGSNQVINSNFATKDLTNWRSEYSNAPAKFSQIFINNTYTPRGGCIQIAQIDGVVGYEWGFGPADELGGYDYYTVEGDQWYELSCYYLGHRCAGFQPYIQWLDGAGAHISYWGPTIWPAAQDIDPIKSLKNYERTWGKAQAPTNAAQALIFFRMKGTIAGASVASSYLWAYKPFFAECNPNQTEPTPWSPAGINIAQSSNLATGAVIEGKIGPDAVGPDKVDLGDPSNMISDSEMKKVALWWGTVGVTRAANTVSGSPSEFQLSISAATTLNYDMGMLSTKSIPVQALKSYVMSGFAGGNVGVAATYFLYVNWLSGAKGTGSYLGASVVGSANHAGIVYKSGIVTAPAGARSAVLYARKSDAANSNLVWSGPTFRPATDSDMLTAGAVTETKLGDDAVTPRKTRLRSDPSNGVRDPDCIDLGLFGSSGGVVQSLTLAAGTVTESANYLYVPQGTGDIGIFTDPDMAVRAGKRYYASVTIGSVAAVAATYIAYINWYQYNSATGVTTYISGTPIGTFSGTGQNSFEVISLAPAGARRAQIAAYKTGGANTDLCFYGPIFRKSVDRDLIAPGAVADAQTDQTPPATPGILTITGLTADIDGDGAIDAGFYANIPFAASGVDVKFWEVEFWQAAAQGSSGLMTGYAKKGASITTKAEQAAVTYIEYIAKNRADRWYKARYRGISFNGVEGAWSAFQLLGAQPGAYNAMSGFPMSPPIASAAANAVNLSWAVPTDPTYYETEILVTGVTPAVAQASLTKVSGTAFIDNTIRTPGATFKYNIRHYDRAGNPTSISGDSATITYRGATTTEIGSGQVTDDRGDQTVPATPGVPTLTPFTADLDGDGSLDTGLVIAFTAASGTPRAIKKYKVDIYRATTVGSTGLLTGYSLFDSFFTKQTSIQKKLNVKYFYKAIITAITANDVESVPTASTNTGVQPTAATAPANVTFQSSFGIFQGVVLTWIPCSNKDYAYTEVQSCASNTFASGINDVGTVMSDNILDVIADNISFLYYRARHVNKSGVAGNWAVSTGSYRRGFITLADMASNSVNTTQLVDGAVTPAKIEALAVTTAKVADLAVTSAKIDALAVATGKIADQAVTSAKIKDSDVTLAKMAINSVDSGQIVGNAVTRAKLLAGAAGAAAWAQGAATGTVSVNVGTQTNTLLVGYFRATAAGNPVITLGGQSIPSTAVVINQPVSFAVVVVGGGNLTLTVSGVASANLTINAIGIN